MLPTKTGTCKANPLSRSALPPRLPETQAEPARLPPPPRHLARTLLSFLPYPPPPPPKKMLSRSRPLLASTLRSTRQLSGTPLRTSGAPPSPAPVRSRYTRMSNDGLTESQIAVRVSVGKICEEFPDEFWMEKDQCVSFSFSLLVVSRLEVLSIWGCFGQERGVCWEAACKIGAGRIYWDLHAGGTWRRWAGDLGGDSHAPDGVGERSGDCWSSDE